MATITAPKNAAPIPNAGKGAKHQLVRPAVPNFTPSHYNPVPVATSLQGGAVGSAYSETISAQGGTPAYTFAVTSGTLPTGTSLASSTGVISGTPSVTGTYSFTITVTDSLGFTGSTGFQIIIATPAATAGGAYTFLA